MPATSAALANKDVLIVIAMPPGHRLIHTREHQLYIQVKQDFSCFNNMLYRYHGHIAHTYNTHHLALPLIIDGIFFGFADECAGAAASAAQDRNGSTAPSSQVGKCRSGNDGTR
jgi:hypothetical protein